MLRTKLRIALVIAAVVILSTGALAYFVLAGGQLHGKNDGAGQHEGQAAAKDKGGEAPPPASGGTKTTASRTEDSSVATESVKPILQDLALVAEVSSWEGKPYVTVYLRNPNKVPVEVKDIDRPGFMVERLCSVKVDGEDAAVHSRGGFMIGPQQQKKLPPESNTSLGILTFDSKVARHFSAYTPVVQLPQRNDGEIIATVPLQPGKHKLEIQADNSGLAQYPTPVKPTSVEVDLRETPLDNKLMEVKAIREKSKKLALIAEADSWLGKPYVKVYVDNPSNMALQLVLHDGSAGSADAGWLCSVKVDGVEADVRPVRATETPPALALPVKISKISMKELPLESKTLLCILAFDEAVAKHFADAAVVSLRMPNNDSKDKFTLLPVTPGKHTLEIQARTTRFVQFPAEVRPVTIPIDLTAK